MAKRKLNKADFKKAALAHKIPAHHIAAVAAVETGGKGGFLGDNRPKILFERHKFWQRLRRHGHNPGAILAANPDCADILSEKAGGYEGGKAEWDRLNRAMTIDPTPGKAATYESASFGAFQVMGFHWKALGYESVGDFVSHMFKSEYEHLDAMLRYVKVNGLRQALVTGDWPTVARGYNGPGYRRNRWDEKAAAAAAELQHKYA